MACDDSDSEQQRITRRRGACRLCREKKVRCNGQKPCSFCEKHEATCVYPPSAPKPPSQALSEICTSHSAVPVLSQHPQISGPVASLPNDSFLNSLASERPSESGDLNQSFWSEIPDFSGFDDGVNFMDFVCGASTNDRELSIGLQLLSPRAQPSTGNSAFDNNTPGITLLPSQQGDDALAIAVSAEVAEPIFAPLSPIISSAIEGSETFETPKSIEFPTKRRKLLSPPSSPIQKRRERQKDVLFPTPKSTKISSVVAPSSYNTYVSALFPSPRRMESRMDESKKSVVNRIAAKLLSRDYLLGLPKAWADSSADDHNQESCLFLENFSALPMKKLFDLCFNEPRGFLNKFDILMLLQKHTCSEVERDQDVIPIIDVFLLGVIATWGATADINEQPSKVCAMVMQILDLRHAVVREPDSIVKFLGLVAMLQYASKVGLAQLPTILAEAVSVAQSLKLHLEAGLQDVCPVPASRVYVKRACWVLFCADKTYAMRWRTFSLLPDIEYDLPPLPLDGFHESYPSHDHISQEKDWLVTQCRYAKICARISDGLAALPSTSDTEEVDIPTLPEQPPDLLIHGLLTDLHAWYGSVPREGRSLSLAEAAASTSSQRQIAIITGYQYHEAVLAVLSLLSQRSSSSLSHVLHLPQFITSPDSTTSSAVAILLASIKDVLSFSYHVSDFLDDSTKSKRTLRILLHVPTLALCTLAVEHVKGNPMVLSAQRECRALFAMAYGFIGRLSTMLPHDEFFDNVTELFGVVNGS
ncbi:hypothetical protein N431DRAFT_534420 [Stipitochalara longipes BDJ]|nr:hypothetical protein N431DRAFT_534420 [Stipitochalara longipes BDJ]